MVDHRECLLSDCTSFGLSIRAGEEVKKNESILCDKNCRLCCWDMKIQVLSLESHSAAFTTKAQINQQCCSFCPVASQISQERENLIVQQITGKSAQKGPPLPNTNHEETQQTQADMLTSAKVDITKGETLVVEGTSKQYKSSSSSRCILPLSVHHPHSFSH